MSPGSACQRCRKRHIKCDGTRPSCKQCVSAKHECPGYNEDWKFINNGSKLPHKRQKRQSSRSTKIQPTNEFSDTTENTSMIQEGSIIESRHGSGLLSIQRTESLDISSLNFPKAAETTLQNLDPSMSLPVDFHFDVGDSNNVHETGVGNLPANFQTSGPAPEVSPGLLSSTSNSEFEMGLAALASEFMLESEQEIVFLLRHYVDNLAPWLGIFDEKCFFQTRIPRLVGTNPALKYAVAALSAKHLSHVGGFRATNCGLRSTLALTEMYPSAGHVDWAFKAANYYHQAATSSQQQSQLYDTIGDTSLLDVATASSAILTVYELIDSNYDEFHARIHDVKNKLARYPNDTSTTTTKSYFPPFKQPANPAALASYWLCMPNDLLHSYDQKRTPILNFKTSYNNVESHDDAFGAESTSTSRTPWVRLFSLIINIIDQFTTTPSSGDRIMKNPERNSWFYLWGALDNWHSRLDADFEPYSHYTLSSHLTLPQGPQEPVFDEILFPTQVSAATLSYYHFARVLLLLAKPIDQSNPLTLLKDYRERLADIRDNCVKICGIAAGRPGGAARIHSIQPLILAGQCLEDARERRAVVQLLQDIESDTGWPIAAQVGRLQEEWYGSIPQS
ncbi:uncharacterized protein TrAtP1_010177 [Trichoderma atroviride]|uniref:uncharacterized protein n=1 Tax=Hypocrea atroviridis TaxID=63577 RepID=UPI003329A26F|nr:hypothetical protein TrAtP1_010177 [Trichoderma atroviride]